MLTHKDLEVAPMYQIFWSNEEIRGLTEVAWTQYWKFTVPRGFLPEVKQRLEEMRVVLRTPSSQPERDDERCATSGKDTHELLVDDIEAALAAIEEGYALIKLPHNPAYSRENWGLYAIARIGW